MVRERGANREREEASGDERGDTEEVRWERGSGGVEPRGEAVPRPRAPETEHPADQSGPGEYEAARRGRVRAPTAGAESGRRRRVRGEDVQSGAPRDAERESADRRSRSTERDRDSSGPDRRYGATGRRSSGDRSGGRSGERSGGGPSDRRGEERGASDPEQSARSAGSPEGQRVGWPGNRRSRVGDTDTGSPHSGSQRGSERESGIAGRAGGHFGEDRSGDSSESRGRNQPEQFGGERGGDERDRRYGSRRGHGSERREDRRTE